MKIEEIGIKEFEEKIYCEYISLFPKEEQREWGFIEKAYKEGIEKFYKITEEDNIIGFFMLESINDEYPYYLDYFGIFKSFQNKGYGTKAIEMLLIDIIKDKDLYIEIEKEEKEKNITIRRADFYRKLNFKKIESEYLLYEVIYTPYVYTKSKSISKEKVDKVMFEYYLINCGKKEIEENCKIIK